MSGIEGVDRVIDAAGRWNPSDIAFIEEIQYVSTSRDCDYDNSSLLLTCLLQRRDQCGPTWPCSNTVLFRLRIKFLGVRDFSIRGVHGVPVQIMGFDIRDVEGSGLEDVRFQIEDYEDGTIALYCRAIQVVDVIPAGKIAR